MRKNIVITGLVLAFILLVYFFVFGWMVPKTAALAIPYKWRNLPVRQSKYIARNYLGTSFSNDTTKERWSQGAKGKMYVLELVYRDTTITGYSIRYVFNNPIVSRSYLLDTFSIR